MSDALSPVEADIALFLHTSGTTSRPKGVPLRHLNLMKSIDNIKNTYALTPDDTSLIVMPLFHVHGLIGACLSTLNSGGTVVVPSRFSAGSFWKQQSDTGSTWYSAVPTIHQILLTRADEDDAPHESFRIIRSCSAALAPNRVQRPGKSFRRTGPRGVRHDGGLTPDVQQPVATRSAFPGHGRTSDWR